MKYISGYKYQLYADEWMHTNIKPSDKIVTEYIELWLDGWMLVKKGYAWDGPSGPTWDTDDTMTPSLFHDAAYQLMRMKLLKPAANPKNKKKVLEVP